MLAQTVNMKFSDGENRKYCQTDWRLKQCSSYAYCKITITEQIRRFGKSPSNEEDCALVQAVSRRSFSAEARGPC